MTDEQIIAKVRAAAEAVERASTAVANRLGHRIPEDDAFTMTARAALAMVEQWEWHNERDTRSRGMEHHDAADRILAALRKAVGE